MEQKQTVTFEMTVDDQIAGTKLSVLRVLKKPIRPLTIVFGVSILLVIVFTAVGAVKSGERSMVPMLPLGLLVLFVLLLYFVTGPNAARRNFRHNKLLHYPLTFGWDASGLEFRSNESRTVIKWGDLYRVMENGKVLLFFVSPASMLIVPKRVLTSSQIEQLREFAGLRRR
jgi:hypothetical protein